MTSFVYLPWQTHFGEMNQTKFSSKYMLIHRNYCAKLNHNLHESVVVILQWLEIRKGRLRLQIMGTRIWDSQSPHNNRRNSKTKKPSEGKKSRGANRKMINSPRKLGKRRNKSENCSVVALRAEFDEDFASAPRSTIRFEEDGDEVVVELHGADTREYPSEDESMNNNATMMVRRSETIDTGNLSEEEEGEITGGDGFWLRRLLSQRQNALLKKWGKKEKRFLMENWPENRNQACLL